MVDLLNKEIFMIIGIIAILFLVLRNFDFKIIIIILVILYFFKEYYRDFITESKKIINGNHKKNYYKRYNSDIEVIFKKLKKYKKKNNQNYSEGIHYLKLFMKQIKTLEHKDLFNYNQYFDKAEIYLKKSINSFQGIIVSTEEKKLIDSIKYEDYDYSLELSNIIKDLYKQGYLLLYNISLRYNKKWNDNPNIFNKQIILDYPLPNDNDDINHTYF